MCYAASFDLIFVVMAESFTKCPGCERSVSESLLSAITAVEANRAQRANVVSTIFDFIALSSKSLVSVDARQER